MHPRVADDLYRTGLFKSQKSCQEFVHFFSRYAFLEPPSVNKHGLVLGAENDDDAKLMEKVVEKQLWKFFKGKQPKLKEVAQENIRVSLIRHLHLEEQEAQAQTSGSPAQRDGGSGLHGNGTSVEVLLPNLAPETVDDDIEQILAS